MMRKSKKFLKPYRVVTPQGWIFHCEAPTKGEARGKAKKAFKQRYGHEGRLPDGHKVQEGKEAARGVSQ